MASKNCVVCGNPLSKYNKGIQCWSHSKLANILPKLNNGDDAYAPESVIHSAMSYKAPETIVHTIDAFSPV